jgi:anaerobic magnesium-protoporphyrin IX monomethyl ester cyclase
MKILVLDVYPNVPFRISKDQNGGYGTANNYGDGIFGKILRRLVKNSIDFPPLYSVQVIGELINQGHEVKYSKTLDAKEVFDLYIIPSSIVCHETEVDYVKKLSINHRPVIVIGPFATSNPENYIKNGATVIKGEPEMFFHKFEMKLNDLNNMPEIFDNFLTYDINELAKPGWEVIFRNYIPKMKFLGNEPAINIQASRGCPYTCAYYCVYPLQQGNKLRLKNPEVLLEEMLYFNKKLKVNNFIFRDPVFSINRNHTIKLFQKIIQSKKNFKICIETHLKNIDNELAIFLKKAGVNLIYVGIESANEDVRNDAKRTSDTNENQIEKVKFLENLGIRVKAMYIIGMPADTKEKFKETINFAKKIKSSYAQFSVFTPYPGTPVFNEYKSKINTNKFEDFTQWQLVFKHENLTSQDVLKLLNASYKAYYINLGWIIHFLKVKIKIIYENFYNRVLWFCR